MDQYLDQARRQLVAKRNDLVQNARQPLTKIQNEVIQYMISKVKPTDEPGTRYTFRCSEFYELLGYTTTSYTDIKALLSEIRKINWWVDADRPGEDDKNLTWFNLVHANKNSDTITISFHEDIEPYIYKLAENDYYFSSYRFHYISLMKSFYSQKLYEQLNTHKHDKPRQGNPYAEWTYEIGTGSKNDLFIRIAQAAPELDQRFRWDRKEKKAKPITKYDGFNPGEPMIPEGWKNFAVFKRDVLEPAVKEINKYTDMLVRYEPLKTDLSGTKHRRYCAVRFSWLLKSEGQIQATERLIDSEYQEIEEARAKNQSNVVDGVSLAEKMEQLKQEQDELEARRKAEEAYAADAEKQEALEKRIENSRYPMVTAEFGGDFTDRQLDFLCDAAFSSMPAGTIPFKDRDEWASDYIAHYKKTVDATADDTRTSPYNRLRDMLKKDYDRVAMELAERYIRREEERVNPVQKAQEYLRRISDARQ